MIIPAISIPIVKPGKPAPVWPWFYINDTYQTYRFDRMGVQLRVVENGNLTGFQAGVCWSFWQGSNFGYPTLANNVVPMMTTTGLVSTVVNIHPADQTVYLRPYLTWEGETRYYSSYQFYPMSAPSCVGSIIDDGSYFICRSNFAANGNTVDYFGYQITTGTPWYTEWTTQYVGEGEYDYYLPKWELNPGNTWISLSQWVVIDGQGIDIWGAGASCSY